MPLSMDGNRTTLYDNCGTRSRGTRNALLALLVIALAAWPALAQTPIEGALRQIVTGLPDGNTQVSACVIDLTTNSTVFSQGADLSMIPASTMKLPVMAAALTQLGPEFMFSTILATDGTNLVVIGDGDPAFGDEKVHRARNESITADFQRWAQMLLSQEVQVIPGDLIIDESIFDDSWIHPSWEEDDLGKWYAAPVGGLNFNGNCVDITASPGPQPNAPALITFQPEASVVEIVNKCRTGNRRNPVVHHPPGTFKYIVSGQCSKRWPFVSVAFPDPGLLFADSLRTVLLKNGISVVGTIQRRRVRSAGGHLPASLTVLGQRNTPIGDVLSRIGKNSQNLFADCLLKRTGCAWEQQRWMAVSTEAPTAQQPQGSWSAGARAVMESMTQAGIDVNGMVVADGSGLNRNNRCTARQLTSLLAWMHDQPTGQLLRESLSIAGVDGSLRKQLTDISGRVHAKTGTMRGVRALAGYVDGETGPRYTFAVIFNGYRGPSTPYKRLQDQFCRILADAARTNPTGR